MTTGAACPRGAQHAQIERRAEAILANPLPVARAEQCSLVTMKSNVMMSFVTKFIEILSLVAVSQLSQKTRFWTLDEHGDCF